MKTKLLSVIAVGLLAAPMVASATIVWDWSFAGETGTFTTSGTASGGSASAGNYILSDFSVTSSAVGGLIGSLQGGQYFTGAFATLSPYSFDWSGTSVTKWNHSGSNLFDWWTFGPLASNDIYFFGWKTGNINDPTQAAFWTGNNNAPSSVVTVTVRAPTAVPEPTTLSLLILAVIGAGLSVMLRRNTEPMTANTDISRLSSDLES